MLKDRTVYKIVTRVQGIKDLTNISLGWFVLFEGSHEYLFVRGRGW